MGEKAGSGEEVMSRGKTRGCREGAGREREERGRRTSLWKAGSSEGFFSACAASFSVIHASAFVISSSRPVVS